MLRRGSSSPVHAVMRSTDTPALSPRSQHQLGAAPYLERYSVPGFRTKSSLYGITMYNRSTAAVSRSKHKYGLSEPCEVRACEATSHNPNTLLVSAHYLPMHGDVIAVTSSHECLRILKANKKSLIGLKCEIARIAIHLLCCIIQ